MNSIKIRSKAVEYKISDVSKMLNISKGMIRYYEKEGVLKPGRQDNNYRVYRTNDIISLIEVLHYQSIGFTIKETVDLLTKNSIENYENKLESYHSRLLEEISYKILLRDRIREMRDRLKACQMNIGKFWFKEIPSHDLYFLCEEKNDNYDRINFDEINKADFFRKGYLSFFDSVVLFGESQNTWWFGINSEYAQTLAVDSDTKKHLDSRLCLCTLIDMGEIGKFTSDSLLPVKEYIEENNLTVAGDITGFIICRGYYNGKYQRILEVQVPIKP